VCVGKMRSEHRLCWNKLKIINCLEDLSDWNRILVDMIITPFPQPRKCNRRAALSVSLIELLTYLLTYLHNAAESFLKSQPVLS